MASAELLRISHNVEGRVIRVDEAVQGVDKGVRDVGDKVEVVQHKVQDVNKRVQDIRDAVQDVCDGVQDVREMVQGVDDKVDQLDRESSQRYDCARFPALTILSQGTTSENAFKLGSLPQIHPLITTFPVIITHSGCGIRPPVRPVVTTHGPFASHSLILHPSNYILNGTYHPRTAPAHSSLTSKNGDQGDAGPSGGPPTNGNVPGIVRNPITSKIL